MKCSKCKAEFEDGSLFCPECGNPVESKGDAVPETNFCPNCGSTVTAGSAFCESCGFKLGDMPETETSAAQVSPPGKNKRSLMLGIGAAAAAVAAAALLVPALRSGGGAKNGGVMYLKDGGMYGAAPDKPGKKAVEYSYDSYRNSDERVMRGFVSGFPLLSPDGKYQFYMEDIEWDDSAYQISYTLYGKKSQKDEGVKIDSRITQHELTADNQVVYVKDKNLYISDREDKEKLASDIEDFCMDKAGKIVFWTTRDPDDDTEALYICDVSAKEMEKTKLCAGVEGFEYSSDLTSIYFLKNEAIYRIKDFQKEEKILNGYGDGEEGSFDFVNNTLYFFEPEPMEIAVIDLVEDDMAIADAEMTEPNAKDYQITEAANGWVPERTVIDRDRYDADYEKYRKKLQRDRLREKLREYRITLDLYSLYYYVDGEKQLIAENCLSSIAGNNRINAGDAAAFVAYSKCSDTAQTKPMLSQIDDVSDVTSEYYKKLYETAETCISSGGKTAVLEIGEEEQLMHDTYALDKEQLYLLAALDGKDACILYSVDLSEKSFGMVQMRDEDVEELVGAGNGCVYYFKDITDRMTGDLYCNKKMVQPDVSIYRSEMVPESGALVCMTDYDNRKDYGTLVMMEGSEKTKIADDVSYWHIMDKDAILLLTEYNNDRARGDLRYYNGKAAETIDVDVRAVFCD